MKPNPITASRLKQLREARNLSQETFAKQFSEFCYRDTVYSTMTLSNWETGRKLPTTEGIIALARFYGTSTDYLLGLSNDEGSTSTDSKVVSMVQKNEIAYNQLHKYDKQALYVKFPNEAQQSQFGIVDFAKKQIQFLNFKMQLTEAVRYFVCIPPEDLTIRNQMSHLLNLKDVMASDQVYIQSLSPDPYVQGVVSGWYSNDPSGKFLINDIGRTLSYEGLGITYNAINYKVPSKKVANKKNND